MTLPISGIQLPPTLILDRPIHRVGRGPAADLRIPHPSISRLHAEIRSEVDGHRVIDLGSRAGVQINGALVSNQLLTTEDKVAFGPVVYTYEGRSLQLAAATGVKVDARQLTVRREKKLILQNVNLSIPGNNFIGILGTSGAGKTTLLKALTGFLPADGQIHFDGLPLKEHRETCRAMMGFVPQEEVLYPTLTCRENLDYALRLRVGNDLSTEERADTITALLRRLRLEKESDQSVRTLSGGQRKRVSVGIELLSRPRLLFLDEPIAQLDPANANHLMEFLREQADQGTTIICTTHVLENFTLFHSVLVVAGGRVLGQGSPAGLKDAFKVKTYAELYEKLENPTLPAGAPEVMLPAPSAPAFPPTMRPTAALSSQIYSQFERGLLLIARDRMFVALLIGQPVLIGLLINLSQYSPGVTRRLDLLLTFAVVACIWLGLNNCAREIVRDRALYARERRSSVSPESYLIAKTFLFALIGLVQVLLLLLCLRYATLIDSRLTESRAALAKLPLLHLLLVCWLTYVSAMLLGFLISTLARTQEVAVAILPLVVLPQLLLSGAATDLLSRQAGHFNSLPVMIALSHQADRTVAGWILEGMSLFTYSRPALVFYLNFDDHPYPQPSVMFQGVVNWSHLFLLLLATATAFVAVFLHRERRWLEES